MTERSNDTPAPASTLSPVIVGIAAWAVPGFGHVLLRRWRRGILFFAAVGGLAWMGYHLRGVIFPVLPPADPRVDPLAFLGGLGDAGAGVFYFLFRVLESTGADVSRAAGDYGTRFLAAAGVANFLCVMDACEIALGRKQ